MGNGRRGKSFVVGWVLFAAVFLFFLRLADIAANRRIDHKIVDPLRGGGRRAEQQHCRMLLRPDDTTATDPFYARCWRHRQRSRHMDATARSYFFAHAGDCPCNVPEEITALSDLLDATGGPATWRSSDNWDRGATDICGWFGVTCVDGHVQRVELNDNHLTSDAPLPSALSSLSFLTVLDLSDNNLSSPFPDFLGNFSNLTEIRLHQNMIHGTLPDGLGSTLSNLQVLQVHQNNLSGTIPDDAWVGLTSLTTVTFEGNNVTGSLPKQWGRLNHLNTFRASGNQLTGTLPAEWFDKGCFDGALQTLELFNNRLTGSLPSAWACLTGMQRLLLHTNQFDGSLPATWSTMTNLRTLDLHGNQLSGSLPIEWNDWSSNVSTLDVYDNRLNGTLPMEWRVFVSLSQLRLSTNQLTGPLPPEWRALSGLTMFTCYGNQLNGSLPEEWGGEWPNITSIQMQNNQFTGTLPASWGSFNKLTQLQLHINQLEGILPRDWERLSSLSTLLLYGNNLSGPLPPTWPSTMTALSWLQMQNNRLNGTLPSEWANYTSMSILYLDNNRLTGTLPASWGMTDPPILISALRFSLTLLRLNNNDMVGTLPPEWGNFSLLNTLSLNNNHFNGTLPLEWNRLGALKTLNLHTNQLSGMLPEGWYTMAAVQTLNLQGNLLNGTLPAKWGASLGQMNTRLVTLHLDGNQLEGTLPSEWSAATALRNLALDSNLLAGSFPISWASLKLTTFSINANRINGSLPTTWPWTTVTLFSVNGNQLTGSLPDAWRVWTAVATFQVVDNRISGTLPASWDAWLPTVTTFSVANNSITGTLPPAWSRWTRMKDLSLQYNQLSGTLPQSWSSMSKLQTLRLHHNSLTGTVPSQWASMSQLSLVDATANNLATVPPLPNMTGFPIWNVTRPTALFGSQSALPTTVTSTTPSSSSTATSTVTQTDTQSSTQTATPTVTPTTTTTITLSSTSTTTAATSASSGDSTTATTTTTTAAATALSTVFPTTVPTPDTSPGNTPSTTTQTTSTTSETENVRKNQTATTTTDSQTTAASLPSSTPSASAIDDRSFPPTTVVGDTTTSSGATLRNETTAAAELQGAAPPGAEVALRDGQASASSSAQVAAMMGSNPSAAMLASRSSSLLSALQRCSSGARVAVPEPSFPSALVPGGSRLLPGGPPAASAHRAAVTLNIAVVLASAVALPLATLMFSTIKVMTLGKAGEGPNFATVVGASMRRLRYPGILLIPVLLGAEGVMASSVTLAQLSGDASDLVVVAVGLLWILSIELLMFVVPFRGLNVHGLRELQAGREAPDTSATGRGKYLVAWNRRWVAPTESGTTFVRLLGMTFAKYHGPVETTDHMTSGANASPGPSTESLRYRIAPYSGVVDFVLLAVSAAAKGVSDASPKECAGVLWAMLGCNLVGMVVVLAVRPFLSPLKNGLIGLSAAVTFLGSGLTLAAFLYPQHSELVPAAGALTTSATACATLAGIVSAVVAFLQWVTGRSDARTLDEEVTEARHTATFLVTSPGKATLMEAAAFASKRAEADEGDAVRREMTVSASVERRPVEMITLEVAHHHASHPTLPGALPSTAHSATAAVSAPRRQVKAIAVDLFDDEGGVSPGRDAIDRQAALRDDDSQSLLSAMINAPSARCVHRSAEGQARYDELVAMLNGCRLGEEDATTTSGGRGLSAAGIASPPHDGQPSTRASAGTVGENDNDSRAAYRRAVMDLDFEL